MSFKSILTVLGGDIQKVFSFIGSPAGLSLLSTGENLAVVGGTIAGGAACGNAVSGLIGLGNRWFVEILKVEALAAGAGQQAGSGLQKAGAVIAAVSPEALAFCKEHGYPDPTMEQMVAANTALVAFGNALAGIAPTGTVKSATP